jgi:chaperone BCS1
MSHDPAVPGSNANANANANGQHLLSSSIASGSSTSSVFEQLTANPFFTAGFGLAALAAAARVGQRGAKLGADLLYRRMLVDVEFTRNDEAYPWVLKWLSLHQGHKEYDAHLSDLSGPGN